MPLIFIPQMRCKSGWLFSLIVTGWYNRGEALQLAAPSVLALVKAWRLVAQRFDSLYRLSLSPFERTPVAKKRCVAYCKSGRYR